MQYYNVVLPKCVKRVTFVSPGFLLRERSVPVTEDGYCAKASSFGTR